MLQTLQIIFQVYVTDFTIINVLQILQYKLIMYILNSILYNPNIYELCNKKTIIPALV